MVPFVVVGDPVKNYPEYFPNIIGSSNITEAESFAILENLLEKLPIDILRPWGDKLLYIFDIKPADAAFWSQASLFF